MATADFEQVKDIVAKYGDKQTIGRMASMGMIEPTTAVLAGMMIDRIMQQNMAAQAPKTTVAQDVFAPPGPMMGGGMPPMPEQPQPMPPQPMQQPMQPQMMRAGGVATLPVPDQMYEYRGGGIVAFQSGGMPEQPRRRVFEPWYGDQPENEEEQIEFEEWLRSIGEMSTRAALARRELGLAGDQPPSVPRTDIRREIVTGEAPDVAQMDALIGGLRDQPSVASNNQAGFPGEFGDAAPRPAAAAAPALRPAAAPRPAAPPAAAPAKGLAAAAAAAPTSRPASLSYTEGETYAPLPNETQAQRRQRKAQEAIAGRKQTGLLSIPGAIASTPEPARPQAPQPPTITFGAQVNPQSRRQDVSDYLLEGRKWEELKAGPDKPPAPGLLGALKGPEETRIHPVTGALITQDEFLKEAAPGVPVGATQPIQGDPYNPFPDRPSPMDRYAFGQRVAPAAAPTTAAPITTAAPAGAGAGAGTAARGAPPPAAPAGTGTAPAPVARASYDSYLGQAENLLGAAPVQPTKTAEQYSREYDELVREAGGDPNVFREQANRLREQRDQLKLDRKDAANLRLLEAGLAIMGGQSPYAFVNIGKGASQALQGFADDVKDLRKSRIELDKTERELNLAQTKYASDKTTSSMDRVENAQDRYNAASQKYRSDTASLVEAFARIDLGREQIGAQERQTTATRLATEEYRKGQEQQQMNRAYEAARENIEKRYANEIKNLRESPQGLLGKLQNELSAIESKKNEELEDLFNRVYGTSGIRLRGVKPAGK